MKRILTTEEQDKIVKLYVQNKELTAGDIGRRFGIGKGVVCDLLTKRGIAVRKKGWSLHV